VPSRPAAQPLQRGVEPVYRPNLQAFDGVARRVGFGDERGVEPQFGGSVGSQDWMKAALTAKAAGVDYRRMRFVAFEGGGEAATALRGGHIQAYMGDAAEAHGLLEGGAPVRVLAIYHSERLPGTLAGVPTALEQGFDIQWPILRGFYVGPNVSEADYQWWVDAFDKTMAHPDYAALQAQRGLFPLNMTGAALDAFVKARVRAYAELADSFGLIKK